MKEKITPHLRGLLDSGAISKQYQVGTEELLWEGEYTDPLLEEEHEVVKGLIHKYANRALIKVSYQCAAHCRFCTRIRQIGSTNGTLDDADIAAIARYLTAHPEIEDVILSGGDPLYTPKLTLLVLNVLCSITSIKVLRIGSRLLLQSPISLYSKPVQELLERVRELAAERPFYILLHVNHPDELTTSAVEAIRHVRTYGATLLSQTVFLKGVNDDFETLHRLFTKLYHSGVMPYYLYHCDEVAGIQHFACDVTKEQAIATQLRASLSGIASPLYIVDIANGHGKIPMPLNFIEGGVVTDFKGARHTLAISEEDQIV